MATAAATVSSSTELELLHDLNHNYVRSVQDSDVAWFDANLSDDFLNSNPDGTLVDRAGFLAQIAKKSPLTNLREQDVRIVSPRRFRLHSRTDGVHQARRHGRRRPLHRHLVEVQRPLALRHGACDAGVRLPAAASGC